MKITVVSRSEAAPEVVELKKAAVQYGVELECTDVTDSNQKIETDALYWRSGTILKKYPKASGRSVFLQKLIATTPVINSKIATAPYTIEKSYQQFKALEKAKKLHPIPTFVATTHDLLREQVERGDLSYPFLAKPNVGSKGEGIMLINNAGQLEEISDPKERVFQNFIENDGDFRVFVIGGIAVDIAKRESNEHSKKWFLNNMCQGGSAVFVEKGAEYEKLADMAETAAMLFGLSVCGVDIIKDKHTGEYHFMEINTAPQWSTFREALTVEPAEEVVSVLMSLAKRKCEEKLQWSNVLEYYNKRIEYMPTQRQFHFLSRMFLWTREEEYRKRLMALRGAWQPNVTQLADDAKHIKDSSPVQGKTGGRKYRKSWYEKHHKIFLYNKLFFKLLFIKTVYGDEGCSEVLESIDRTDLRTVWDALRSDSEAIAAFSTQAINFMYHTMHFFGDEFSVTSEEVMEWSRVPVSISKEDALEAKIYLLTHAVIGASFFYSKEIDDKEAYVPLVKEVERLLKQAFVSANLDMKFEFLVCCSLVGYTSEMESMIWNEAEQSYAPHGNYYIDTFNLYARRGRLQSLTQSEHRNVLAIMVGLKKSE